MSGASVAQRAPDEQQIPCRVCNEFKTKGEFYKRQVRKDLSAGECKDCTRSRVSENREAKLDYYQAYDRKRYRDEPKRKVAAQKSARTPAGVAARKRSITRMKSENPEKYKARTAVSNAIRDGKIERGTNCYFCESDKSLHAHHEDYGHPLDVVWLCPSCHGKLHTIKGDFRRSGGQHV